MCIRATLSISPKLRRSGSRFLGHRGPGGKSQACYSLQLLQLLFQSIHTTHFTFCTFGTQPCYGGSVFLIHLPRDTRTLCRRAGRLSGGNGQLVLSGIPTPQQGFLPEGPCVNGAKNKIFLFPCLTLRAIYPVEHTHSRVTGCQPQTFPGRQSELGSPHCSHGASLYS